MTIASRWVGIRATVLDGISDEMKINQESAFYAGVNECMMQILHDYQNSHDPVDIWNAIIDCRKEYEAWAKNFIRKHSDKPDTLN